MPGLMFAKRTLALAAEGTYGTLESLAAGDVYKVENPEIEYDIQSTERDKNDGTLGNDTYIPEDAKAMLRFVNWMHGDGSSGDAAWAAELFPCVGMPSNASNSYRTSSTQTDWKGLSAALNRDGFRKTGRGGMGSLKTIWLSGKAVRNEWAFTCGYNAKPSATSQLTSITFEEVQPPKWAGSARATVDGSTTLGTKMSQATVELLTGPFARHDPNAVGGYIGGWLENVKKQITFDPEADAVGSKDWQNMYDLGTLFDIVLVTGTSSGNTITQTCEDCQLKTAPKDAARNGLFIHNLVAQILGDVTVAFS